MVEFFIMRGVKRGEEWIWQATHDEYASQAQYLLEQWVGADGMTRWDIYSADGQGIYSGSCFASTPLVLIQDRCVPTTWTTTTPQEVAE